MISRINSAAITARFLFNATARVAIAMTLGFAAGKVGIFPLSGDKSVPLYFAIGLFPSWALDALRERARTLFGQKEAGCDILPTCLIDGLDDGIADRLAEIGTWDVQHLAACNPIEIALRTLYPLSRVLDWVDQAILICHVRGKITAFRAFGVRGAVQLAMLYGDAAGLVTYSDEAPGDRRKRSGAVLNELAKKSELSLDAVKAIARSLFEDYRVNFIWDCGVYEDEPYIEACVQAAAREAAHTVHLRFVIPPGPGQPVRPSVFSNGQGFAGAFEKALRDKLAGGRYRWKGAVSDFRDATEWSVVLCKILEHVELSSEEDEEPGAEAAPGPSKPGASPGDNGNPSVPTPPGGNSDPGPAPPTGPALAV